MTNSTSTTASQRPLARLITAVHQGNPILQAAILSRRVATIFPTLSSTAESEQSALYPGYYLRCADGNNYWIGSEIKDALANLERACSQHLKSEFGFEYDVEYSFGYVVGGASPWANMSAIDLFM